MDLIDRASAFCNDHSDSGIVIFQLDRPLIERTNLLHLKQLQKCNDAVKKVSQDTFRCKKEISVMKCIFDHTGATALVREAKVKLESKKKSLIEVLTGELRADKSVRGGPRAARKAVQLLVKLDRSSLACQLFLRHRAAILHNAFK